MKIGKASFDGSVKKYSFKRFKEEIYVSSALKKEMNRNGYLTCESAFKAVTGKDAPKGKETSK